MTDETIRKLRDPVAVHVAMLRGEIAVPPLAELLHVYGATFSDLDAANVELAKARETIRQLRAQLDEQIQVSARIASERAQEMIRADLAEMQRAKLRAQLDEYERAPTVATVESEHGFLYLDRSLKLPEAGTELIARPARKGGVMTTDELRRMLELAARACGAQIEPCICSSQPFRFKATKNHFSPHLDDGASARIRTALRMNVIWSDTAVHCLNSLGGAVESFADHDNDRNAALRLCALRVAAMIGEGMK